MFGGRRHKRGQKGFKLKIDPRKERTGQTVRQAAVCEHDIEVFPLGT